MRYINKQTREVVEVLSETGGYYELSNHAHVSVSTFRQKYEPVEVAAPAPRMTESAVEQRLPVDYTKADVVDPKAFFAPGAMAKAIQIGTPVGGYFHEDAIRVIEPPAVSVARPGEDSSSSQLQRVSMDPSLYSGVPQQRQQTSKPPAAFDSRGMPVSRQHQATSLPQVPLNDVSIYDGLDEEERRIMSQHIGGAADSWVEDLPPDPIDRMRADGKAASVAQKSQPAAPAQKKEPTRPDLLSSLKREHSLRINLCIDHNVPDPDLIATLQKNTSVDVVGSLVDEVLADLMRDPSALKNAIREAFTSTSHKRQGGRKTRKGVLAGEAEACR